MPGRPGGRFALQFKGWPSLAAIAACAQRWRDCDKRDARRRRV
jgi:hypothetical protein